MSLFLLFSKAKANFLSSKAFLSKIWVSFEYPIAGDKRPGFLPSKYGRPT